MPRAPATASRACSQGPAATGLSWPAAIDGAGRRALYLAAGDVFVLDVAASAFSRLTATASAERRPPSRLTGAACRTSATMISTCSISRRSRSARHPRRFRDGPERNALVGVLGGDLRRRDIGYWWSPTRVHRLPADDESAGGRQLLHGLRAAVPRVVRQRYPRTGTPNPRVRVGIAEVGRPIPGGSTSPAGPSSTSCACRGCQAPRR